MTPVVEDKYEFSIYSSDDTGGGMAMLVESLLQENMNGDPKRRKTAARITRPVVLSDGESGADCTVLFGSDSAFIFNDLVGSPSVVVTDTTGDQLLAVSQLKMRAGGLLPTGFFTPQGIAVIRAILRGELIVKGLVRHPITVLRFIALVSVA